MSMRYELDDNLVQPLLARLSDPDEGVRGDALWALVRLPLSEFAWSQIANYILERLGDPSIGFNVARHKLIQTAVYVPDLAVRNRVRNLLRYSAAEEDRRTAALALVRARDNLAVPTLINLLPGGNMAWREEAALALAGADMTDALTEAKATYDATAIVAFWAATALAENSGTWAMDDLERGRSIGTWPAMAQLAAYLQELPPLKGDAQDLRQAMDEHKAVALAARWLATDMQPQSSEVMYLDAVNALAGITADFSAMPALSIYESVHAVRFWLALALARAGEMEPLAQMIRIGVHPWVDPIRFQDSLENLSPLPFPLRAWLKAQDEAPVGETTDESSFSDDWLQLPQGSIAQDILSSAHFVSDVVEEESASAQADEEVAGLDISRHESREAQVEDERKAWELLGDVRNRIEWAYGAEPGSIQSPPEIRTEQLAAMPAPLATQLVTALWDLALAANYGIGLGNEIGQLVMALNRPFAPDLQALFSRYVATVPEDEAYGNVTPESLQLAWLISRAGLEAVLASLKPFLEDGDAKIRAAAAVLMTLVAQYANVDYAPMFGGGSGPSDTVPPQFPDDSSGNWESYDQAGGEEVEEEEETAAAEEEEEEEEEGEEEEFEEGDSSVLVPSTSEVFPESGLPVDKEAPQRVINTGFSLRDRPEQALTPFQPLQTGSDYYYWFEEDIPDKKFAIDSIPSKRPEVPAETELTIALFEFAGGLQVQKGGDVGQMKVDKTGWLKVLRQPLAYEKPMPKQEQRLYFPLHVPDEPGEYRLRCNMYWGQMLLQSRLVTVQAIPSGREVDHRQRQLRSDLDYTISNSLDAATIEQLAPHRLSLMLNGNGDGTHSVHIFGRSNETLLKQADIRFYEGELEGMVKSAREKLRRASWVDKPDGGMVYRYGDGRRDLPRMQNDLVTMAKSGYKFYAKFINTLDPDGKALFKEFLATTGLVQIAFKRSPRQLLPAALIYDYPLYTQGNVDQYRLCSRFEQAFNNMEDLMATPCFQGECPEKEALMAVCPSGFWGFRHSLGMPVSICDLDADEQLDPQKSCQTPDAPAVIRYKDQLQLGVGLATDLDMWAEHKKRLQSLKSGLGWTEADDLNEVFETLQHPPHLLYFYCHGGIDEDGGATLRFGSAQQPARISGDVFEMLDIRWQDPRPLVFINGCHTAAVSPEQALELVTPLIRRANASGVIGTEVTIFEPLATRFAEVCLGYFLSGTPIGEAIRLARLALLMEGNPLGVVYIPFVQGGLRLVAA